MGPDNQPIDGKPHSYTVGFGCVKRLKHIIKLIVVKADSKIRYYVGREVVAFQKSKMLLRSKGEKTTNNCGSSVSAAIKAMNMANPVSRPK